MPEFPSFYERFRRRPREAIFFPGWKLSCFHSLESPCALGYYCKQIGFQYPAGIMDTAQQSTPAITHDQRTRVLLEAPVLPTLLKLAAPNMLVMLAQMSTGIVEAYFVARLGVDALAGASLVFPVLSLISAVSQGAVGGGVVSAVARALGRGQRVQASELVWYAVAIAACFGLLTSAVIL